MGWATENGYVEIVRTLLVQHRDSVDPSSDGNVLITRACAEGHKDVVKVLLTDPRVSPEANANSPFRLACRNGHVKIARFLLRDSRVEPHSCNNEALRKASENGHAEVVELLLDDPRVDPTDTKNYAIRWACQNSHFEVVRLLLKDHRVDPSVFNNAPLCIASKNGKEKLVQILLSDNRVQPARSSALYWACHNGHASIVQQLLAHPADYTRTELDAAIRCAITNGHHVLVRILLGQEKTNPAWGPAILLLMTRNAIKGQAYLLEKEE